MVKSIVDAAVGDTRPDLTLLFLLPYDVAEARRLVREPTLPMAIQRDRIEEAGQQFFERAAKGYQPSPPPNRSGSEKWTPPATSR